MKRDKYRPVRLAGWLAVGAIYLLTLATQLPHIIHVYAGAERTNDALLGISTAVGAAVAFELSVAIFTLRMIVATTAERSRWTRAGVVAFLAISAIANVSYYFDFAILDRWIMPAILAVALPAALWLYAEEFGRGAKAESAKRAKQTQPSEPERNAEPQPAPTYTASCDVCDWSKNGYKTERGRDNALIAHRKIHLS